MSDPDPVPSPEVPDYRRAQFLTSAAKLHQCPPDEGWEVAFAGRSNAGKSSAINSLTNNKKLAKTSKTPGRTQLINFFELSETQRLVDLPGYGFAKAPPKVVETWRRLVRDFLRGRVPLRRTLLLVDARHGIKPVDLDMMQMLDESAASYRVVLTKADKIKASALETVTAATEAEARKHPAAFPQVHVTSAEKGTGIAQLRAAVLTDAET